MIDGTGGPPSRADVAPLDTMIAEVGRLDGAESPRVLDVTRRYVVPSFIDAHAHVHGDAMLPADPIYLPALRQGVTTYILGQDGSPFAPASPATMDFKRRYTAGFNGNPPEVDLTDRGLIRPGCVADIAVFDPAAVTDRSTCAAGRTLAEGVEHVLVNGTLALLDGEPTGATPGRAQRRS